jgi:hypothetical protein
VIRQRLRRGIAEGDLPRATDINALASFYTSVVDGMAIQSRDGTWRETLNASWTAPWDKLAEKNEADAET